LSHSISPLDSLNECICLFLRHDLAIVAQAGLELLALDPPTLASQVAGTIGMNYPTRNGQS
jgi:hypothetical protein